jgi:hypothetical protein
MKLDRAKTAKAVDAEATEEAGGAGGRGRRNGFGSAWNHRFLMNAIIAVKELPHDRVPHLQWPL